MLYFLCFALSLLFPAQAQSTTLDGALEAGEDKVSEARLALGSARDNRTLTKWTLTGNFTLLETWVLTKYGFTAGYNDSASNTYEFEYMRGSLSFGKFGMDIGGIDEQRFALVARSFNKRNSFNVTYGVFYSEFDAHLGNDILATVSGVPASTVDLARVTIFGFTGGLGNRWQMENGFVWGVDWIMLHVPLFLIEKEAPFLDNSNSPVKKDDVADVLDIFRKVPGLGILKFQVGLSY